ncbi:hypothetical protein WJX77_010807 [Trebouxia sp. C0004]
MQCTQQQTLQTCPSLRQHKPFGTNRPTKSRRVSCASARAVEQQHLQSFPTDYSTAVRQAQNATLAAIADGHKLIEVEFPTSSLQGVSGDAEGCNEMTYSMGYLRQFCRSFQQNAAATRIFFPDKKEMEVAKTGKGIEEEGGAVFDVTKFQLDYLTTPSGLLDIGIDLTKVDITARTRPADELYIIAYPHFNVNEIIAVDELYQKIAKDANSPIVVFNGELDRIRSGYYPALFFPKLGKLAKTFIPHFESAYYIHNFKGHKGGVLFRAYPDPWQVLRRHGNKLELIHTQETMPVLKDVALKILPAS